MPTSVLLEGADRLLDSSGKGHEPRPQAGSESVRTLGGSICSGVKGKVGIGDGARGAET